MQRKKIFIIKILFINIHTLWQSWPYGKKPIPLKAQNDVNDNDIVVVATVGVIVEALVVDAVAKVVDAVGKVVDAEAKVVDAVVEAALVSVEVLVTQTTLEAQSF